MDSKKNASMRFSNLISFLVLGILEASWAPMVPFVKNRFGLSEEQLGWLLLCTGVGAVCFLPISGFLTSRFGARLCTRVSGILMGLALFTIAISPLVPLTAICLFIFGAMTISLDVCSNVNGIIVEHLNERPLMSGFHGGYSLGALMGSFGCALLLTIGLSLPITAGIVLFIAIFMVIFWCKDLIADIKSYENQTSANAEDHDASPVKTSRFIPPLIILIGFLNFVMYGAEGTVMNWSAVFAHQERGLSLEYAGFIYSAFAITMTASRLLGNKIVTKVGRRRTVVIGGIMVSVGFFMTLIPSLAITIAGFALIGLGTGNIVPQVVSFAGTVKGYPVHKTIAVINAIGYSGILCAPVVIGFIAEHLSIAGAFFVIGCLTLIVAAINFIIMRPQLKKKA